MTINILTFGIAREIAGGPSFSLAVDGNITAGELKTIIVAQYPALQRLTSLIIAVNNQYAQPGDIIKPGDEIALIPPVSGG